ncbi:MAG: hypothetical protein QOD32_2526 [Pyrinomonadaceae bacterium]|jgi:hypothetical protein|nr:hypothetical protein [Pyrinomonadaceae bacterium]
MHGVSSSHITNSHPVQITVSSEDFARLKRRLYSAALLLLFISVVVYVIFRDAVWKAEQQNEPAETGLDQSLPMRKTMFAGSGISGQSFTAASTKTFHLTVRGLTGSHIVINRWRGQVVYSSSRGKKGQDFDDEIFLEQGDYVITLVAKGKLPAEAFIELR